MNTQHINHEYLNQLVEMSREQDEDDLIDRLLKSLETEHAAFVREPILEASSPERRNELQARVHKLKNVYFNLGCERVGHVLEEMYQALKTEEDAQRLPQIWSDFIREADETKRVLRLEITTMTH